MTTEVVNKKRAHKSGGALLLEFFSSMNLAITLLVTVGIASIVGTVLKQNEPYQNYISKFGPFWFEVFNSMGLYDVYSAAWFLLILAFLVLSTSTCIYRNAPLMLHDMRSYRPGVRFNSLNAFHNINPVMQEGVEKELHNFGPNFSFKLRNQLGEAIEYENYRLPVDMEGRQYFLSGARRSPAAPFQYLYIPVDADGGIERFIHFKSRLHDLERVGAIARGTAEQSVAATGMGDATRVDELSASMTRLVTVFTANGFEGVAEQVNATVPEACLKVLQTMLASLYTELLADNGVDVSQGISEKDGIFFDEAINAIGAVSSYGSPLYVQLMRFEHIQSTGLQIARAPGKTLVYLGFVLLIAGVFCMFYVSASRLWCWIDEADGQVRLLIGGSGMRHKRDFGKQFARLEQILDEQFRKF